MTDEIDNNQERMDIGLADAIRTARQPGPVIVATGRCLYCDEVLDDFMRWCGNDCQKKYMREKYGK